MKERVVGIRGQEEREERKTEGRGGEKVGGRKDKKEMRVEEGGKREGRGKERKEGRGGEEKKRILYDKLLVRVILLEQPSPS